jgi:low affinity Fe/Cu permease
VNELFRKFANRVSTAAGSSWAFLGAVLLIVVWAASRPIFKDFDTWQLVINTGTTIITFLMVFLIQNTQNRDAAALHLKLDELIRSAGEARNTLIDIEDLSDEELKHLKESFHKIRQKQGVETTELGTHLQTIEAVIEERTGKPEK